jgi:hypothetical protein
MWMIDRVHNDTADMWTLSLPSVSSGFSHRNVLVIDVSNLPDGRHTGPQDPPHFSGLQANLDVISVTAHHLSRTACAPDQLPTLTKL